MAVNLYLRIGSRGFSSTELRANYVFKAIASPVGLLKLVARDAGLAAVLWENDDPHRVRLGPMVRNPRT